MPITNELGIELKSRLAGEVTLDMREGQSFEDWLTLQITPMPFLSGFANSRRFADAERVIDEIAAVLDQRVERASEVESPRWLRQLVALWDFERAVVLTFNYDTLLERAVNCSGTVTGARLNALQFLLGDHVVFPAPPATQAQFLGDTGAPHNAESMQVLKLHGSLAWYWAGADKNGSTLARVREKHVLGSLTPLTSDADFSGATKLDRYLIPPVTSKDGYYGSYLANTLWRSARAIVETASSLTLVGYSLPLEDRVASQLIAEVGPTITDGVVDQSPGSTEPREGVLGRLATLGLKAEVTVSGHQSLPDFVSNKIKEATEALPRSIAFDQIERQSADVVVAIAKKWGSPNPASLCVLVWDNAEKIFAAYPVDRSYMTGSSMPYRSSIHNSMPLGAREIEDFVTADRLRQIIAGGQPFVFRHPNSQELLVGIGAERIKIERWEFLQIKWAPAGA